MPYIKPEQRPALDAQLEPLIEYIQSLPVEEQDGSLNYAFTKLLHQVYPEKYFHLNRALGLLEAVTQEFYRRKVAPYEDTKIAANGDVS